MSDKEKALFLLSPLTDKKNKIEILRKTIHLTELYENIDFQEKRDMLDIQLNFAHEWFEDEDFKNIGGLKMGDLLTEGAKKHIEQITRNTYASWLNSWMPMAVNFGHSQSTESVTKNKIRY